MIRVSVLLSILHVNCTNHLLNLEVEKMMESDEQLKDCIEYDHKMMMDCRSKLRNRSMLINLTTLVPKVDNETRWSGKYLMLRPFQQYL